MATNLSSASITIDDALYGRSGTAFNTAKFTGARLKQIAETIEVGTGEITDSVIRMFRVWSFWSIRKITVKCDALTTGTVDIGLYKTAAYGGGVVDQDCYATALSLASAITTAEQNQAFEVRDHANVQKRVWEDGASAYTADPHIPFDLAFTVVTGVGATGTVSAILEYSDGN